LRRVSFSATRLFVRKEAVISSREKQRVRPQVAPAVKGREIGPRVPRFQNPFTKKNYIAFAVGLGLLLFGYICLGRPPADGFLSLTLAPILLVLGYCVVFPYAILAREKPKATGPAPAHKGD